MAAIHIRCKRPPQPDGGRFEIAPGLPDCEVMIDGNPATNVRAITWTVRENEPATATIEFYDVTIDAEAIEPARAVDRCSGRCDHGSQCTLSAGHGDRHETEHGCICYDPADTGVGRGVCLGLGI